MATHITIHRKGLNLRSCYRTSWKQTICITEQEFYGIWSYYVICFVAYMIFTGHYFQYELNFVSFYLSSVSHMVNVFYLKGMAPKIGLGSPIVQTVITKQSELNENEYNLMFCSFHRMFFYMELSFIIYSHLYNSFRFVWFDNR